VYRVSTASLTQADAPEDAVSSPAAAAQPSAAPPQLGGLFPIGGAAPLQSPARQPEQQARSPVAPAGGAPSAAPALASSPVSSEAAGGPPIMTPTLGQYARVLASPTLSGAGRSGGAAAGSGSGLVAGSGSTAAGSGGDLAAGSGELPSRSVSMPEAAGTLAGGGAAAEAPAPAFPPAADAVPSGVQLPCLLHLGCSPGIVSTVIPALASFHYVGCVHFCVWTGGCRTQSPCLAFADPPLITAGGSVPQMPFSCSYHMFLFVQTRQHLQPRRGHLCQQTDSRRSKRRMVLPHAPWQRPRQTDLMPTALRKALHGRAAQPTTLAKWHRRHPPLRMSSQRRRSVTRSHLQRNVSSKMCLRLQDQRSVFRLLMLPGRMPRQTAVLSRTTLPSLQQDEVRTQVASA